MDLRECCSDIMVLHRKAFEARDLPSLAPPSLAIKDKFADRTWHCVSTIFPLRKICSPRTH